MPSVQSIPEKCRQKRRDQKIVLKEKRSKIVFENPQRLEIEVIQVDECAIRDGKRCDHLVLRQNPQEEYFIELKGSDIQKAFDQLARSIKLLSTSPPEGRRECIVVTRRVPRLVPRIQKAQKRFRKDSIDLKVENSPCRRTLL